MVKKAAALLFAALIFIPAFEISAEGSLSLELGINSMLLQTRDSSNEKYLGFLTAGSADLSFKSTGSKNVKAELSVEFTESPTPLISIERAYVKARFPEFRLTAGKTRLGWGDGFVFNSGDVIFGSTDTAVDLTSTELRTETEWLTAVNIPFGRFSFFEAVIIPPSISAKTGSIGRLEQTSGGGRLYTKLAGVKIEGGYFLDQTEVNDSETVLTLHKPYISLQGNLTADWYLSASTALSAGDGIKESAEDSLNISGGLFHMISLSSISTLSFRLEGLYRPFHSWSEKQYLSGGESPLYALMLYPEISWTPTDTVSLSVRSIWSPVDNSAMTAAGAGWNVFEGFDISCYGVLNAGDPDDSFSWNRADNLWTETGNIVDKMAVVIGVNYIY